jgi:hypothetical protein
MQFVDPAHQGQIIGRHGAPSLCAQQADLAERTFQKIVLQGQLADLGMQRLDVSRWGRGFRAGFPKRISRTLQQLTALLRDLVGVHIELLRQLG